MTAKIACPTCRKKFTPLRSDAKFCSAACRQKTYRHRTKRPRTIVTSHRGHNDKLMREVAKLYIEPGSKVCDPMFGKGTFWRLIDKSKIDLHVSDLVTTPRRRWDCRSLPYDPETFDVVVLDPPYQHTPRTSENAHRYNGATTTPLISHKEIIELYRDAMAEAWRILKYGGTCLVKCQDQIMSGRQCWAHVEILHDAEKIGFEAEDLFVLTRNAPPAMRHVQIHARKNHSFLWVFRAP